MTKKESIKKNKAKKRFEQVCADYAINPEDNYRDIIKTLVEKASELQGKIDEQMDEIKTTLYEKFTEIFGDSFGEGLWMSLVNMNNKRGYASEKAVDKMKDKIEKDLFNANTLNLFLKNDFGESFENGSDIVKYPEICEFNEEFSTDSEADGILRVATEKRSYIGRTLMVEYKRIFNAVRYLIAENTYEDIKSGDFKTIVDFVHYSKSITTEGDEEAPKNKVDVFTDRISKIVRTSDLLGQNIVSEYLAMKGLKIVRI